MGSKFFDIGLCNNFLDMSPRARAGKVKINEVDFKINWQHTEWQKIFANDI